MPTVDERVAVVTGAAQGIGRGIAARLARDEWDIVVVDLPSKRAEAEQTIGEIRDLGRRAEFMDLDVTDLERIPEVFERGVGQLGTPTILVNNAGVVVRAPALEVTAAEWRRVIDTCLTGSFFCSQSFARRLVAESKPGAIVNVASVFGLVGGPQRAAYSAAKAGLVNLTRVLAYEWHRHHIRVNAVAPTFVSTPMTKELFAQGLDVVNKSFDEALASIKDVAHAVRFLASSEAEMITGCTLPVDGGWVAW